MRLKDVLRRQSVNRKKGEKQEQKKEREIRKG
jgi:hypothetical protein